MSRIVARLRRLAGLPGVPQARHMAERTMAPYLRADLRTLGADHSATVDRLGLLELKVEQLLAAQRHQSDAIQQIAIHQPTVLNAIASTNGTTRLVMRELHGIRAGITGCVERQSSFAADIQQLNRAVSDLSTWLDDAKRATHAGDDAVRDELRPHIESIGWLMRRVETVRAEFLHELRYGAVPDSQQVAETRILNPSVVQGDELRVNVGAGHLPMDGYANVDVRELPGIDVVAPAEALPFEPGSVTEIYSSHTLEHFPEIQLRRKVMPHWFSLLRAGGMVRAVVPDLEAMSKAYADGSISFETLRSVAYGGQEYEGDFHFTGFTPSSLADLLVDCGFERPQVIARGRPNGDCLECEIAATRPAS